MNKMNSFVKEFVALIKGNNIEVTAQKAWRQAESALKSHIAVKEGESIRLEDDLEEAKENLNKARINNGEEIKDSPLYINNLIRAKNKLIQAEEAYELHIEELQFLREEYANLSKDN